MVTASPPLLDVRNIVVTFPSGGNDRSGNRAVDDVSLIIPHGSVVGLVGESGCGKTTLGRTIAHFQRCDSGSVLLGGTDLAGLRRNELRQQRRRIQMIFQNPFASLDPRMTAGDAIGEAFPQKPALSRHERLQKIGRYLEQVGLDASMAAKFPHEFSGGQRQRIAIARALAAEPQLIIADEPVSSLDVSVAAQVLNLLRDIRTRFNLSMLFISHDLSIVRYISDHILIMFRGRIVESGPAGEVFTTPLHPYTRTLIEAVPVVADTETAVPFFEKTGEVSDSAPVTGGCVYCHRCSSVMDTCKLNVPDLRSVSSSDSARQCACFRVNPPSERIPRSPAPGLVSEY